MIRRIPIVPTLVVLVAVAAMIGLGIWQLQRRAWKEALIARYAAVRADSPEVPWPRDPQAVEAALFRRSSVWCDQVLATTSIAGRSARGEQGVAQVATCRIDGGGQVDVALGWAVQPAPVSWAGGKVSGIVASGAQHTARLIADPPQAGLAPLARPDPRDVPNNHLAYAVQWFLFATVAAVIYALALAKRLAGPGRRG